MGKLKITSDVSQIMLLQKFDIYCQKMSEIEGKKRSPFLTGGFCSGISAYWLYKKKIHEEQEFFDMIQLISTIREDSTQADVLSLKPYVEEFFSTLIGLQFPAVYFPGIRQSDKIPMFEAIAPNTLRHETSLAWNLSDDKLKPLLEKATANNKMILLSHGDHDIGLMLDEDGQYAIYDSNSPDGPEYAHSITDVIRLVRHAFLVRLYPNIPDDLRSVIIGDPTHLAADITVFDTNYSQHPPFSFTEQDKRNILLEKDGLLTIGTSFKMNNLHLVTYKGNIEQLKYLFKNIPREQIEAALVEDFNEKKNIWHWAAIGGDLKVLEFLKSQSFLGKLMTQQNALSWAPIQSAISYDHEEVAIWFLNQMTDDQVKNCKDLLWMAASSNMLKFIKELYKRNPTINMNEPNVGDNGKTALHYCVEKGYYEWAKWLIKRGADVNALNAEGKKAIDTTTDQKLIALLSHPENIPKKKKPTFLPSKHKVQDQLKLSSEPAHAKPRPKTSSP